MNENKLMLTILIASVIINVITVVVFLSYYRKFHVLKRRYIYLSDQFDTLSASYYMQKGTDEMLPGAKNDQERPEN